MRPPAECSIITTAYYRRAKRFFVCKKFFHFKIQIKKANACTYEMKIRQKNSKQDNFVFIFKDHIRKAVGVRFIKVDHIHLSLLLLLLMAIMIRCHFIYTKINIIFCVRLRERKTKTTTAPLTKTTTKQTCLELEWHQAIKPEERENIFDIFVSFIHSLSSPHSVSSTMRINFRNFLFLRIVKFFGICVSAKAQ